MIITHKILADLIAPGPKAVINAVQTDTYCRKVEITVTAGGQAVEFPEGVTVRGSYRKADGTRGIYDTMPDGQTDAGSVAGNVVTLSLAPQLLTAAGTAELAVQLISGETLLNVFPIQLNVAPLPGFGGKSENYYSVSGLPQITEADNGKVLTVVDGMWVAGEAVAGSGGTVSAIAITESADGTVTMVNTLSRGETETIVIGADANGNPNSLTYNGVEISFSYTKEEAAETEATE